MVGWWFFLLVLNSEHESSESNEFERQDIRAIRFIRTIRCPVVHINLVREFFAHPTHSNFIIPETVHSMVVHHTDSLHESVADGWTYERKAPFFQVTAHGL